MILAVYYENNGNMLNNNNRYFKGEKIQMPRLIPLQKPFLRIKFMNNYKKSL